MSWSDIQRRTFFTGAAALSFLGLAPAAYSRPKCALTQAVARVFRHPDDATMLGRAYLGQHTEDHGDLLSQIFGDKLDLVRMAAEAGDDDAVRDLIAASIDADLRAARIFVQDGWVIARAEARLCAVLAAA